MAFGLKNTGATYQRMVTRMFWDKIGSTMEVYIDDIMVKSKKEEEHVEDLIEAFEILRRHKPQSQQMCIRCRCWKILGVYDL